MIEKTIDIISMLFDRGLDAKDANKLVEDKLIMQMLKNGANFDIYESVEKFGEENSDNDLYEKDGDFYSWGNFLLSVPGEWRNKRLPSGKVFSLIS